MSRIATLAVLNDKLQKDQREMIMNNNKVLALFNRAYNQIAHDVEYDRKWSDGKGYHTPFSEHQNQFDQHEAGSVFRVLTPGDRRMIIVKTPYGAMLIYERYIPNDKRGQFLVVAAPPLLEDVYKRHFSAGGFKEPLDLQAASILLGETDVTAENIGFKLVEIQGRSLKTF